MTEILIILGLIMLNGFFSMVEIALVSARKARLEAQANKGDRRAKAALDLAEHPDKFLSTIQIGITLIGVLTGIYSGESFKTSLAQYLQQFESIREYSNGIATTLIVIVVTYFTLVLGELLPKRIGLSRPEWIAKFTAGPMRIISLLTFPFIWLLNKSTHVLVKLLRIQAKDTQVTEEEIKAIISEGTEQGTIEEAEQEIIERVFHLGDRSITSLMTHRSDIIWFEVNDNEQKIKDKIIHNPHTVYPVCEGDIDVIKGIVSLKDLYIKDDLTTFREFMQPALFIPENITAYKLLEKFKERKQHACFIVDEYGSVQGMVT
ncbi:MAG: hemolysin family protein, partial [Chitinophagaceae bacterium]